MPDELVARDVIVNQDRGPLLYDGKGRPLVREVGFRIPRKEDDDHARDKQTAATRGRGRQGPV